MLESKATIHRSENDGVEKVSWHYFPRFPDGFWSHPRWSIEITLPEHLKYKEDEGFKAMRDVAEIYHKDGFFITGIHSYRWLIKEANEYKAKWMLECIHPERKSPRGIKNPYN